MRSIAPLLFALAVWGAPLAAQDARDALLVTGDWLQKHLKDENIVLLHIGDRAEYDREHIPGARFVRLDDVSVNDHGNDIHLELPAPADLEAKLEALGISDGSRVIVYYGNDWVSPATRVLYTLQYAGLGERSSLLDGGMQAWKREGGPVTSEVTAMKKGSLTAKTNGWMVVNADYVKSQIGKPSFRLVDARAAVFYDGTRDGGGRSGHITGARSIPFTEITDDRLAVKPAAVLAKLFADAGVTKSDTLVLYCHIGQQATAVFFAARTLGIPVRLYDGSFTEWAKKADYPVTGK